MALEAVILKLGIYDGDNLVATIEAVDRKLSMVEIKGDIAPADWDKLIAASRSALAGVGDQ